MAAKVIRQTNGKLAVFNTVLNTIDLWDTTPEMVVEYMMAHKGMSMDWHEAITVMRNVHGWEAVGKVLDGLEIEEPPAHG